MVFINNVMWIIESVVVVNIVINLFTNNSVMSLVISCVILGSCELMRNITTNPNQKSQRQHWWQRADCDYWLCDGSTCSNTSCDDVPFVDNLDCGDIGDGCEGITDIGCEGKTILRVARSTTAPRYSSLAILEASSTKILVTG